MKEIRILYYKRILITSILAMFFVAANCQVNPIKRNRPQSTQNKSITDNSAQKANSVISNSHGNNSHVCNKGKALSAKIEIDYNLASDSIFYGGYFSDCGQEQKAIAYNVTNQFVNEILTNNILAKYNIKLFREQIEDIVFDNTLYLYDREFENPLILHMRIFYHREINNFLHKLIQNKSVRSWTVNFIGKYLQTMCAKLPKDFTERLLNELEVMYSYVDEMNKHKYTTKPSGWFEEETLLIDGKEARDFSMKSQGFIIRRVIYDGIPKNELKSSIVKIIKMVKSVNIANNPDTMLKCNINNDLTYYMTTNQHGYSYGSYFIVNKTKEKIPNGHFRIIYKEAYGKGKYYFEHGYYRYSDGKWEPSRSEKDFTLDSSGMRY